MISGEMNNAVQLHFIALLAPTYAVDVNTFSCASSDFRNDSAMPSGVVSCEEAGPGAFLEEGVGLCKVWSSVPPKKLVTLFAMLPSLAHAPSICRNNKVRLTLVNDLIIHCLLSDQIKIMTISL